MTETTNQTLAERIGSHRFPGIDGAGFWACSTCRVVYGTSRDALSYDAINAHLADVVRAWLAEQAARDDVVENVANSMGSYQPASRLDRARAANGLDAFLAALDRRPDGPAQPHSADLRAEQGQVAHGDHDDAAGLSEAQKNYCGQTQPHQPHTWVDQWGSLGGLYTHRPCGGYS